jgi:hypothetical protein
VANGCYVVPSGWTLVAFAGNQTTACPAQSAQANVFEGPNANSACGCNCDVTTPPTCPPTLNVTYDAFHNNQCNGGMGTPPTMPESSSCSTQLYTGMGTFAVGYQSLDLAYTPDPPTGGACSASAIPMGSVTYAAQDRICTPNTEPCSGGECMPSFGAGLQVCISASGSQACPSSTFSVQHVVGGAATYTCSGSACTCNLVTGTCSGTATLYVNNDCTGGTLTIPADGMCHNESKAGSNTYQSFKYEANPLSSTCTTGGTATAQNVALSNPQTVCCTQ